MRGRFINIHNILIKTVNIATLIDLLQHKWVEIDQYEEYFNKYDIIELF